MLTGKQIAVIGGDNRQLEMIKIFIDYDASVNLIGFEHFESDLPGITQTHLHTDEFRNVDAVVLPVAGIQQDGSVESIFTDEKIVLSLKQFQQLAKKPVVFTGIASDMLRKWCEQSELKLVELLDRDDVAIYNSIPTVEGAIMLAIQQTDFTIHGSKCVVLGLGRVGFSMAKALKGLGAIVEVGVRKNEHFARAYELGLAPFYMNDLESRIKDADIIFNTVPALILTADVIVQLRKTALIIDLASKPGGTDFRFADKRGIKSILALGLPGKVAAKTAGRILANVIVTQLQSSQTKGGG
ncbi:MAG: dipicolinic acid synthetase subunit [Bacillota bacterium]|jgi:dipicolinate synthase subunit A